MTNEFPKLNEIDENRDDELMEELSEEVKNEKTEVNGENSDEDNNALKLDELKVADQVKSAREIEEIRKSIDLEKIKNQDTASKINHEVKNEEEKILKASIKIVLEEISGQSKTMLDALYQRQQDRLTPMQNSDHFQKIVSQIKNLEHIDVVINKDSLQEVIGGVKKLRNSFQEFRVMPSGGMIRENKDNLDRLVFGAKKFGIAVSESGSRLPVEIIDKEIEEDVKELKVSLAMLAEDSQKLWLLAAKMRERIS